MKELITVIDCNADPIRIIDGFTVAEHILGGVIEFDPSKVLLWQSEKQAEYWSKVQISELRAELEGRNIYNVHVFDYLMRNSRFIPSEWRYDSHNQLREIYFFGTIYANPEGTLSVWSMKWRPNDDPLTIAGEGRWEPHLENITVDRDWFSSWECILIEA